MRRLLVLALLLFALPVGAQDWIRYYRPGSSGSAGFAFTDPLAAPAANNCAAIPYSFAGDTNTGICTPVVDEFAIKQGGEYLLHSYVDPTSDGGNFFLGLTAGNRTMGPSGGASNLGSYNFGLGKNALHSVTTGHHNFGIGSGALEDLTTGIDNTAIGYIAGRNIVDATYNTIVGNDSGQALVSGSYNAVLGVLALYTEQSGGTNTALGYHSLYSQNGVSNNTAVGASALTSVASGGGYNTALGKDAGHSVSSGQRNLFLGPEAGYYETGSYKVMIDSRDRGSEANGRLYSLIYGVVDPTSTMTGQYLYLNAGHVSVRHLAAYADNAAALAGGLVAGDLYMVTGTDPRQVAVVY